MVTTGFFAGWTGLFAVGCGLFAQGLFAFLAATYLTVDSEGEPELQNDFRRRALISGLLLAPAAALVFFLARADARILFDRLTSWWSPWLLLATSVCAVGALVMLGKRRFRTARMLAAGQVTLILLGWTFAQYPYLIVPDVSIFSAATSDSTLRLLTWILAAGAVVLFPSFAYLFAVFKKKNGP